MSTERCTNVLNNTGQYKILSFESCPLSLLEFGAGFLPVRWPPADDLETGLLSRAGSHRRGCTPSQETAETPR